MNVNESTQHRRETEPEREDKRETPFDFTNHGRTAEDDYRRTRHKYEALTKSVRDILSQALEKSSITVHSVDARAKDPESLRTKAETPSDTDTNEPKYRMPLEEITDLAGVRIIAFFPKTIDEISTCIREEFAILEHMDHGRALLEEERFGYQSEHFLVTMTSRRTRLSEYRNHADLVCEIQVRTILQHAWAEIEHDIQYKTSVDIPITLRRRFLALASLLELADREFQALQDEDESLKQEARESVERGAFSKVEITADALRSYLDKKIGADERISNFSYEWMANILRRIGFRTFAQVEECISHYDDDEVSRALWGSRQGQVSRFEDMVLAGTGETFVERATKDAEWRERLDRRIAKLRDNRIIVRDYDPKADATGTNTI